MSSIAEQVHIKRLYREELSEFEGLVRVLHEINAGPSQPLKKDSSRMVSLLSRSGFFALAAIHVDRIIGGLIGYELENYLSDQNELFVHNMGLLGQYRESEIGHNLLEQLVRSCLDTRIGTITVNVRADDEKAAAYYEQLFGRGKKNLCFQARLEDWK